MLSVALLSDPRADSAGSAEGEGAYRPWRVLETPQIVGGKCQCVNTPKGYASSVTCRPADVDNHMMSTGSCALSLTVKIHHWTETGTQDWRRK